MHQLALFSLAAGAVNEQEVAEQSVRIGYFLGIGDLESEANLSNTGLATKKRCLGIRSLARPKSRYLEHSSGTLSTN